MNLEPLVTKLQQDPASYRAFGPFWWFVKNQLRAARIDKNTLAWLGRADDPAATAQLRALYPTDDEMWRAALHHFNQKATWGETRLGHSHLPDGTLYDLKDPDLAVLEYTHPQ